MQEAFREAARQNPRNPVAREVFQAADQQRKEARERREAQELERLKLEFRTTGNQWFLVKGNPTRARWQRITEQSVRQNWQKSVQRLQRYRLEDQALFLKEFCDDMGLSEETPHQAYSRVIDELSTIWGKIDLLQKIRGKRNPSPSPISRMFLGVFKDISSYSQEQKKSLDDFIESGTNLPPEEIQFRKSYLQSPFGSKNHFNDLNIRCLFDKTQGKHEVLVEPDSTAGLH